MLSSNDIEAIARNANALADGFARMSAAYMRPYEMTKGAAPAPQAGPPDEVNEMTRTLTRVAEAWMSDPEKALAAQARLSEAYFSLWGSTWSRMRG